MKGYTSRDRVEKYLLITIDETFHAQVDEWIEDIEAHIEKETGRVFVADGVASARHFDGDGTRRIDVDDCVSIEKVEIGVDESGYGGLTSVESADYMTLPNDAVAKGKPMKRIELRGGVWPRLRQGVKVTGKWGYASAAPSDIRLAATVLVAGIINYSNPAAGEVSSETIGRYSVSYKTEKQWQDFEKVAEILKSYKRFTF